MNYCLLYTLFLSVVFSELVCQSNQVYVKVLKNSKSYSNEESYEIWDGETKLVTSPTLPQNYLHTAEYCIAPSTNHQYTIFLKDSYGDGWSAGSYVQVQGLYGNTVFKNFMKSSSSDSYTLSLYYPFMRNDQWKVTSGSVTGSWTEASFNDAQWNNEYLGFVVSSATGTQYFRKSFTGVLDMAAYELSMNYRYGIIVYLNGAEVYRDNMPAGPVTSETAPTGQYSSLSFHTIIRPGNEILASNIMAIEIHVMNNQNFYDFDTYMALIAPSIIDTTCFIYSMPMQVTNADVTNIEKLIDFTKNSFAEISQVPASILYGISEPKAYINGLGIYPNNDLEFSPSSFSFQGTNTPEGDWNTIVEASGIVYEKQVMRVYRSYNSLDLYSNYRAHFETMSGNKIRIYEMIPLICNIVIPTSVEFTESTYTHYTIYDVVSIRPIIRDFTNCQISPLPSNGLTFDPSTCTLSGSSSVTGSTTYTITSSIGNTPMTGSFTLVFQSCSGTFVKISRTYKTDTLNEGFNIIDRTTQQSVLSVALNTVNSANTEWSTYLCLSGSKYEIETFVENTQWAAESFLYVRAIFDTSDYETIIRVNRDDKISMPVDTIINVQYAVPAHSNWYYKMGEVPANWHNSATAGWVEKPASGYPESTNQIQLYKKTFNVASVEDVAGLVVSLKYQYGVLIYLNGHEVFRKGINGDLSASTMATTTLSSVKYRQISLPVSGSYKGGAFTNFIQAGANTIAIALVASDATMKTSTFDAAVRLMGSESVIRNFEYSISYYDRLNGYPAKVLELSSDYDTYNNQCEENVYLDITFNDDRHEWLSSISLQGQQAQTRDWVYGFSLYGKNAEDEEWTLIKTYTALSWSQQAQRNRYWTLSTQAFNQYRFSNFEAAPTAFRCVWQIGTIQLLRESVPNSVPALSYENTSIFKDIEMAELYPNSDYYTNFSITPALPEGIVIDSVTGMISGTTSITQNAVTYTVNAVKANGGATSCTFTLESVICTGGKSLITLMAHTDTYPEEMYFKLYNGKGTTGTIVRSIEKMKNRNTNNYFDFCLPHGLYTYQFFDKYSDGWTSPSGYYLSVDVGALKFAVGHVAKGTTPQTFTFSSFLPFQIDHSEWKVYKSTEAVSDEWNTINFDDSAWTVTKAADIGTNEAITTYIRKEIVLDDNSIYNVLNVRVKYLGGLVAYFNGRKVARFNLPDYFTPTTESTSTTVVPVESKFHVLLGVSGSVTGKNIMAFEIHRVKDASSALPISFDATGVFDVNDCSFAVDSYTQITGTSMDGSHNVFFDYQAQTTSVVPNDVGSYTEWTVENLEGSKFNGIGVVSFSAVDSWAFSLYGRNDPSSEYTNMFQETDLAVADRVLTMFSIPVGVAGYKQFKLEYDYAASADILLSEYVTMYCRATGEGVCPGIDDFPAVSEGEVSPGSCPAGFDGYAYRVCHDGVLGEIKTENCFHKVPADLKYAYDRYTLVIGTNVKIAAPTYRNIITNFSLGPNIVMPKGLNLDATTGAITGIPEEAVNLAAFTIYGENPSGATETVITFTIRVGECKAEGEFAKTLVGQTAIYQCSTMGSFVGSLKRTCNLGQEDGEWSKVTGSCVPVFLVVIGIVLVMIVLVIIIFVILRMSCRAKSTGGKKGKKTLAKQLQTQPATKEVKV